jgi:hypothetical protein
MDQRKRINTNQPAAIPLHLPLVKELEIMLRNNNRYVKEYISSKDIEQQAVFHGEQIMDICMTISETGQAHSGVYVVNQLGAFIPGGNMTASYRTVFLRRRNQMLQKINNLNAAYHPLHYPLLFPYGEPGWCPLVRGLGVAKGPTNLAYTRFRLHYRPGYESRHLLQARWLMQEYLVDSWAQIEDQELDWYRHNQDKLRTEAYSGIADAVLDAGE